MSGNTGYTGVTNDNQFTPPADITAVYEHFDPLIGEHVATAADLPASGDWVGRQVFVVDAGCVYVWNGAGWVVGQLAIGGSLKRSDVAHTFSGSAWSLITDDTFWAVDQPMSGGVTGPSSGKLTVPIDGVYAVEAGVQFDATVTVALAVKKNSVALSAAGAVVAGSSIGLSGFTGASISKHVRLAAGDYLVVGFYLSANAALTISAETGFFAVRYVEPLR